MFHLPSFSGTVSFRGLLLLFGSFFVRHHLQKYEVPKRPDRIFSSYRLKWIPVVGKLGMYCGKGFMSSFVKGSCFVEQASYICQHPFLMGQRTLIMDPQRVEYKLQRIARQLREKHSSEEELVILGIRSNGERIASRLRNILQEMGGPAILSGSLAMDKRSPVSSELEMSLELPSLDDRSVILVDDVVNSGRTLAYTTRRILERPLESLTTVALVDREHHRFPIRADLVGTTLATTMKQHIEVEQGADGERVYLE
ncbi:MAG: phosphoribosyltransferase family protein [Flavobacteriales bacterium]